MRDLVVLAALASVWLVGMPAESAEGMAFAAAPRIEHELERGLAEKADVRKLLGEPQGGGECFLPGQNEPREVWFYEDIAMTGCQSVGNVILMDARQQILLVFFKGDKFDGFLWTSNEVSGSVE
jgi:hypothetical protein